MKISIQKRIKEYFKKRNETKKKNKFFRQEIKKTAFPIFLKLIDQSVENLMKEIPDKDVFLHKMGEETARWINELPFINQASFKAGACYGIYLYCKLRQEQETRKDEYIS